MPYPADIQNITLGESSSHTLIMDIQEADKFGKHGWIEHPVEPWSRGSTAYDPGNIAYPLATYSDLLTAWELDPGEAVALRVPVRESAALGGVRVRCTPLSATAILRVDLVRVRDGTRIDYAPVQVNSSGTAAQFATALFAAGTEPMLAAQDVLLLRLRNVGGSGVVRAWKGLVRVAQVQGVAL